MDNSFTKELMILPGICDSSARLGVPDAFAVFMDAAAEHACLLGCGFDVLGPRGLFWLTVRTRVRFERRPAMLERVRVTTWPERPGRLRANRSYVLERDGARLAAGRTEWTIIDQSTLRLHPVADVFAPELDFRADAAWEEPFERMPDRPLEEFARYTVRSTDIDLGGHMNNAAYVRALAGLFTCGEWQGMDVRELEIAYRSPCYEGDVLCWQREAFPGGLSIRAAAPDGKTIALARVLTGG